MIETVELDGVQLHDVHELMGICEISWPDIGCAIEGPQCAYANGRLPDSALASIPNGRLERNAARSWNAMRSYIGNRHGVWIRPLGPNSSYRTYASQQYFWNRYKRGGNVAAYPGTSNHGWGKAVDVQTTAMAYYIRVYGGKFGWSWDEGRRSGEWWHMRYVGGYSGGSSTSTPSTPTNTRPVLKRGSRGDKVRQVQRLLREKGFSSVSVDGHFGASTQLAVQRLHRAYGHDGHGHVGPTMWKILLDEHPWRVLTSEERAMAATLLFERRVAKRNGGWHKIDPSHLRNAEKAKAWLEERNEELHRLGLSSKSNRARRHRLLHQII